MPLIADAQSLTVDAIYRSYVETASNKPRPHLGASQIGRPCAREIWYRWRWCAPPIDDGRLLRLFQTGHLQEPRLVEDLRRIGVKILETRKDGRQWRVYALGGHFAGSMDGVAQGLPEAPKTWALLEFKTSASKAFRKLQQKGIREAKPEHWAQIQTYMHLAKLKRCMYLAVSKETDNIYQEWVRYDPETAEAVIDRARRIIEAATPPPRISDDPTDYRCGWCDMNDVCHEGMAPPVSCRTCVSATPVVSDESGMGDTDGEWRCERHQRRLAQPDQRAGCADHIFIPPLVGRATPIDSGDGHVLYQIGKKRVANVASVGFPGEDVDCVDSEGLRRMING